MILPSQAAGGKSPKKVALIPSTAPGYRRTVTTLIATSVVRGSRQGESHGGVYLIDLDAEEVRQVIDWNTPDIDWQGRGWDRGLRGIAFHEDRVYIAASDELFVYDPGFERVSSHRNPYLKHCHEICCYRDRLYLTSTGFDSILAFDPARAAFTWGLQVSRLHREFRGVPFNPAGGSGPPPRNELHLNNVHCNDRGMYLSGTRTLGMLHFNGKTITRTATLPQGVHNAQPFADGVIFNDTEADVVRFASPDENKVFRVPRFDPARLTHTDLDDSRIARQAFGRGLTPIDGHTLAAGSSPSTIAIHDLAALKTTRMVNLSLDIRNAIHGLEVWPY